MSIRGIIFDLDGVICSTDIFHYQAWKALADSLGIYFDWQLNDRLRGISRMESLELLLCERSAQYSGEQKAAMAQEKNSLYRRLLMKMTPEDVSPEVLSTLYALRAGGYALAVGSSSKNAGLILKQIGLADFFDAVADGTQIKRSKPDPEVFLLAARLINTQPNEAIVVEDASAGIEAAKSGGFLAAGIGGAAGDKRADYSLSSLSGLIDIVRR